MRIWASVVIVAILSALGDRASGQNADWQQMNPPASQPSAAQQAPADPDQPVMPQDPQLRRRTPDERDAQGGYSAAPSAGQPKAGPPQPQQPFALTPVEEAQLDRVLLFWEKSSQNVKTFRAKFRRFEYNDAWADKDHPDKPIAEDDGELRYQAPDKGLYSVDQGPRVEKWICDGKSIFEYDFRNKVVREYKLPPEVQGKMIANGPVPFLFGAKAEQLKRRYWMRIITPPEAKNEVWLEAYPKTQADAQNFRSVEVILSIRDNEVMPTAVQIHQPGGKARTVYRLWNITVNQKDVRLIFEDPFHARVPAGWQKLVENPPQGPDAAQRRSPGSGPAAVGDRRTSAPR